ncbi:MAG TPA: M2 family metallopeptidase [Rubricoccaceae bacterium]
MPRPFSPAALAGLLVLGGCSAGVETVRVGDVPPSTEALGPSSDAGLREEADLFLAEYNRRYVPLSTASSNAEWDANTRIVEGDTAQASRLRIANEALAAYTGSVDVIERAQALLARREALTALQARQLDAVLYAAASSPQTVAPLVRRRIAAEAAQTERLYGYTFRIDSAEVTPNELDETLRTSTDLAERRAAWEASKAIGPTLTEGLLDLRDLRNGVVQALGYDDFFAYQVRDYGQTSDEMLAQMRQINDELRPLYRELHTWARYELAGRYGQPVPEMLPADWLPNRWGQDWSALADAGGESSLDSALATHTPQWVVEQGERFYTSIGFEPLPRSFYDRSSLYPLPAGSPYKTNTPASAWHMDLDRDVRSLMSVEANPEWYETTHHELGHIYYYLSYTRPEVPPLLRRGANRAYHEAVGSLMGLAAMQPRFVEAVGLAGDSAAAAPDPVQNLLREALSYVVFIPFSTGVMPSWEHDLYAEGIDPDEWNARWWQYAREFQGIVPPDPSRAAVGSPFNDAATKTHINDDPAQYYDYALSYVLLFQLHDHIAREILHEDPRDTNYYGRREVGDFLRTLLRPGALVDGDRLLEEATGQGLTAQPMLDYFEPLMEWLRVQNAGRTATI